MTATRQLALRSRRLLVDEELAPGAVLIDGERIVDIHRGDLGEEWSVEDLGEAVVMAGLVDSHVHINEPGRESWEGFATATRAAAAGGLTTLVDMPLNSSPVTMNVSALEAKCRAATPQLTVDCAFWAGVVPGGVLELESLLDAGARGAKAFLVDSGIDEFPAVGEEDLRPAMEILARRDLPLLAHAELPTPDHTPWSPKASEVRSYQAWLESRPPSWEVRAIDLLLRLCRETGCPLHIVHLATEEALPRLIEARTEGLPVTVETCPHYLTFRAEDVADGETRMKCAPPVRRGTTREALWQALTDGHIDLVASDHSPAPPELKHVQDGDFQRAWGGVYL